MRGVTEAEGLLVIQGPNWLGLLLIALAIVLTILVLVLKWRRPVRLGAFLGTIVMLYVGWHLIGTKTTLEPRGYYVESIYGEEERRGWLQVRGIAGKPGGNSEQLVLQLKNSNEASIDLAGLTPDERARVIAYVRARL